jgi:glycosyltransferase involved in cell wall biosynthesis
MSVRVSVIVPTYNTGAPLQRLVDSLDAQTLPTGQFEAIFVDDGSSDDTATRLEQLCAARPNYRTTRIPNSGWPGRPRNVGLDMATGEYVFSADHDDHLAPDALQRMHDYASANSSDIVIGREVRVGRRPLSSAMFLSDQPSVDLSWPLLLNLLTPHKMFRRDFLITHDLRFPEGKRRLEDHAFVLPAYFRAKTISVLGGHPCYFWDMRADGTMHSSQGIDPDTYYPYLTEILDIVEANTEPGPERDRMLSHWYRGKVMDFIGRSIRNWEPERQQSLLRVTSELARTRFAGVDPYITPVKRVQSALLRAGHLDPLIAVTETIGHLSATPVTRSVTWHDGLLVLEVGTTLCQADGSPVLFRRREDRVLWVPPEPLGPGVDEGLLDLTDAVADPRLRLYLREPSTGVNYEVAGDVATKLVPVSGGLSLTTVTTFRLDPRSAAHGSPLDPGVWRARLATGVGGLDTAEDLPLPEVMPGAALLDGMTVVPFARRSRALVLAVSSPEHPLARAVHPQPQDVSVQHTVSGSRLRIELRDVHARGSVEREGALHIGGLPVPARLVADPGGGSVRLESWLSALPGTHPLQLALGGKPVGLGLALRVAGDGQVTAQRHLPPKARTKGGPLSHPALRAAVRRVPGLAPALRRLRPVVRRLRARR